MTVDIPQHVFFEAEFLALIVFSLIVPVAIYGFLFKRASISKYSVIALAIAFIVIAGVDLCLLQRLADAANASSSAADDLLFASELSMALYLFPAVFAGIGVNLLSHILTDHLHRAESRHDKEERLKNASHPQEK